MTKVCLLELIFSVVQSEREVDAGFVAYHSRRTEMSSSVRPRPDCSLASSMSMRHLQISSLSGSLRASLRRAACGAPSYVFCHFAEPEFLNLARRGFGQLREHDMARGFVAGEILAAPGDDLLGAGVFSRLELDKSAGRLAPFLVGLRYDSSGLNAEMFV